MTDDVKVEITPPKLFNRKAIITLHLYGTLGWIPIVMLLFLAPLIFKLFPPGMALSLSLMALCSVLAILIYFYPIVLGNPYVKGLIRCLNFPGQNAFITQLTLIPRLKSGFRAFVEDADDIGVLSFGEEALIFNGDSTRFSIPFNQIRNLRKKNIGWRGLWLYGNRITVDVLESAGNRTFEFSERFSLSLPTSRRISKELFNLLSAKIQK